MVFSNKNNVFKFSRDAKLPNCQFSANIWGSFVIIADSFDNSRTSLTIYNYRVLFPTREDPTFQPPFSSGGGAQSVTDSQKQKTEFQTNFPISPPASTKSQILRGVFSPPTFCRQQILNIDSHSQEEHNNRDRVRTKLQGNGLKKVDSIKLLPNVMQLASCQDVNTGVKSCPVVQTKNWKLIKLARLSYRRRLGGNGRDENLL